ncbi:hypothetical protein DMA11_10855 [Marinilabiliaceae bacterium JC017]|nr:hypothetical protein DMA11_10855 [Marinilabiliaceae bacterium JC017]
MSKNDLHMNGSFNRFFRYLFNRMSNKEQHGFERDLMRDPFEAEALEGLSTLTEEELIADVNQLAKRIEKRSTPKRWLRPVAIAASIALIGGMISILVLLVPDRPQGLSDARLPEKQDSGLIQSKPSSDLEKEEADSAVFEKEKSTPTPAAISEKATEEELLPDEAEDDLLIKEPMPATPKKNQLATTKRSITSAVDNSIAVATISEEHQAVAVNKSVMPVAKSKKRQLTHYRDTNNTTPSKQALMGIPGVKTTEPAAHPQKIYGFVNDESGMPLPGVNVLVAGSNTGSITNTDGYFEMNINPSDTPVNLTASFIGFKPRHFIARANDSSVINLEPELLALDEVVTVGYGSEKESTPSTETVKEKAVPQMGLRKYKKLLESQLVYPSSGSGAKEMVKLKLTISSSGSIINIMVLKSPGTDFTEEAKKAILNGPEWQPATENNLPVNDDVIIKLRFTPKK